MGYIKYSKVVKHRFLRLSVWKKREREILYVFSLYINVYIFNRVVVNFFIPVVQRCIESLVIISVFIKRKNTETFMNVMGEFVFAYVLILSQNYKSELFNSFYFCEFPETYIFRLVILDIRFYSCFFSFLY